MAQNQTVYFGYGSNMWRDQMDRRCPENKYLGIAFIDDWKWFICERGFANIRRSPGDRVYGLIYELSKSDEKFLDGYEGVPKNYVKEYHTITLETEPPPGKSGTQALIYISEHLLKEGPPKTEYVYRMNMAIADGIKAGISEEYMDKYLRRFIPKEYEVPDGN